MLPSADDGLAGKSKLVGSDDYISQRSLLGKEPPAFGVCQRGIFK